MRKPSAVIVLQLLNDALEDTPTLPKFFVKVSPKTVGKIDFKAGK